MIQVVFLDKEYQFHDDLLNYLQYCDDFREMGDILLSDLSDEFVNLRELDKGIAEMRARMKSDCESVVRKLFSQGVYNLTENDFGEKMIDKMQYDFQEVINKALSLSEDIERMIYAGAEDAMDKANSETLNPGFALFSNSALDLFAFSLWEGHRVARQATKIQMEYEAEVQRVGNDAMTIFYKELANISFNDWYPKLQQNVQLFSAELLDEYISALIDNGLFDANTIENINVNKTQTCLKYLSSAKDKKDVLRQAFDACPFSLDVYFAVANEGYFTTNEMQCLKSFNIINNYESAVLDYLQEYANGRISSESFVTENYSGLLSALSIMTDVSVQELIDQVFSQKRQETTEKLRSLANKSDEELSDFNELIYLVNNYSLEEIKNNRAIAYEIAEFQINLDILHQEDSPFYEVDKQKAINHVVDSLQRYALQEQKSIYARGMELMEKREYSKAEYEFMDCPGFLDADLKAEECRKKAEEKEQNGTDQQRKRGIFGWF